MGERINEFRKSLGLSVEEFAEKMGYSISAITKFLYGEKEPGKNFFKKLKKIYPEVDLNIFFAA
ncbi:MAG: helix-turn-helix transcriptional regulator [Clostridia bacterium]|nr:helix-turn-helix transcriptional regulator [Clostridia bacterium]